MKTIIVQRREKKFANFAKLGRAERLSRARKKYLATTYKPFFSALYNKADPVMSVGAGIGKKIDIVEYGA